MGLKPMNCPAHIQIYNDERHSYRDLPVRYCEAGLVHRHEASRRAARAAARAPHHPGRRAHLLHRGAGPGGGRRSACASASSCTRCSASSRAWSSRRAREKRIGSDEMWDRAEAALAGALDAERLAYELNPGDGAFYGPKIDLHMTDSLGRSWQLGTVQLDYSMPERFELALHRRRQRRAPAGDDPPRAARLLRALHRDPDRALRRRVPAVARRPCRRSCCRSPTASTTTRRSVREALRGERPARRARRRAASRSAARSARPSCARSPTCSWSASARSATGTVSGSRAPRLATAARRAGRGVRREACSGRAILTPP